MIQCKITQIQLIRVLEIFLMKTLQTLLETLRHLDIQIWAEQGFLHYDAPKGILTSELLDEIRRHKLELVNFLQQVNSFVSDQFPPIVPISRDRPLLPSYTQQRLWFLDRMMLGKSVAYNIPVALRLEGHLQVEALKQALSEIVRRHETLRTLFSFTEGTLTQVIKPVEPIELPITFDFTQTEEATAFSENSDIIKHIIQQEAYTPFDLSHSLPIRTQLLRLGEELHILLLTVHHIAFDGWSETIFAHELSVLYNDYMHGHHSSLPELPIQYVDFAYWQREWLNETTLKPQYEYWKKQLKNAPPLLELPLDHPRPYYQSFKGKAEEFIISQELSKRILLLSQWTETTLFMVLLTAFAVQLSRYSRQEDIVVGSPILGRPRKELESLIGFFVNTLVLRINLEDNPRFEDLLAKVRQLTLVAYENQDVQFDRLIELLHIERNVSYSPLFQVMFVFQHVTTESLQLTGIRSKRLEIEQEIAKFDLTLVLEETETSELKARIEYNSLLFDSNSIQQMAIHYLILLEGIVANPQQTIHELPLLSPIESQQLIAWDSTDAPYPDCHCIHQLFESQVEQNPNDMAVIFENQSLTYYALDITANQLAHYLQSLGVKPETIVGIYIERSLEMIVGLLAILKAGGAYLPLDPSYPKERLQFMIEDTKIDILLTQKSLVDKSPTQRIMMICLDSQWSTEIARYPAQKPTSQVTCKNLAYVIYTSGSTGKPKGTLLQHQGLCNLAKAQIEIFKVSHQSQVLQFASLSFDASIWEIVMALCSGATLHVIPKGLLLGNKLEEFLSLHKITHATFPPSVLASLPEEKLPDLTTVIVAGESCPSSLVKRWAKGRQFFNAYGPTETTVCATIAQCTGEEHKPPIGRPLPNVQLYILDDYLKPVPIGVAGELYISGVGIARGYLNRPELTNSKFITFLHPLHPEREVSAYRTGDLARYLPDGNVEFVGRIDQQVKLRGFRIELEEIEAVLKQNSTVKDAIVLLREDTSGDKRLVAYIISMLIGERLPVCIPCTAEFEGHEPVEVLTENISCHGLCLNGIPFDCEPQQSVKMSLRLPGVAQKLSLQGHVVWYQDQCTGIKLEFDAMPQLELANTDSMLPYCENIEHIFKTQGYMKFLQRTSTSYLRTDLRQKLPDYMIPSAFVFLEGFPLTPSGKIDRSALPMPDTLRPKLETEYVLTQTEQEQKIIAIWQQLLKTKEITTDDNFFELGGHSLLITRLQAKLQQTFDIELSVTELFEHATVHALAQHIVKRLTLESIDNALLSPGLTSRNTQLPADRGTELPEQGRNSQRQRRQQHRSIRGEVSNE